MANERKIQLGGLEGFGMVSPGRRITDETAPIVKTNGTLNSFGINRMAAELMGLRHGDKLIMFHNPNAQSKEASILMVKSKNDKGVSLAGQSKNKSIYEQLGFSYGGLYSVFLAEDVIKDHLSQASMEELGLMKTYSRARINPKTGEQEVNETVLAPKYGCAEIVAIDLEDQFGKESVVIDGVEYDEVFGVVEFSYEENPYAFNKETLTEKEIEDGIERFNKRQAKLAEKDGTTAGDGNDGDNEDDTEDNGEY